MTTYWTLKIWPCLLSTAPKDTDVIYNYILRGWQVIPIILFLFILVWSKLRCALKVAWKCIKCSWWQVSFPPEQLHRDCIWLSLELSVKEFILDYLNCFLWTFKPCASFDPIESKNCRQVIWNSLKSERLFEIEKSILTS